MRDSGMRCRRTMRALYRDDARSGPGTASRAGTVFGTGYPCALVVPTSVQAELATQARGMTHQAFAYVGTHMAAPSAVFRGMERKVLTAGLPPRTPQVSMPSHLPENRLEWAQAFRAERGGINTGFEVSA
jgi:hypothetical protein